MALSKNALTTVEALEERLGVTGEQRKLESIINRVSVWVEGLLDRKVLARNYDGTTTHTSTEIPAESIIYVDGKEFIYEADKGMYRLHLPSWPIKDGDLGITFELAELQSRDESGEIWSTSGITEWGTYILEAETGTLYLKTTPTFGYRQYRIKATLGHNTVPEDLEQAVIEVCAEMHKGARNVSSERLGSWAKTYDLNKVDNAIYEPIYNHRRFSIV